MMLNKAGSNLAHDILVKKVLHYDETPGIEFFRLFFGEKHINVILE
jgi:hypothetical protein